VTVELAERFARLTTPHLADACVRAGVPVRCGPAGLRALTEAHVIGRALPARHAGSVDVFLEAMERTRPGDILVADNGGRLDESCIGDLLALEAREAGIAAIVIWGLHRDSVDIHRIGIPLVSLGTMPTGPLGVAPREPEALVSARLGDHLVTRDDLVAVDADGVLLLPADRADELFTLAEGIRDTERRQADLIASGTSLREQVGFARFLAQREVEPDLTFREHLRRVGGEIEV
jgi:regulator of RNase E activity RraA